MDFSKLRRLSVLLLVSVSLILAGFAITHQAKGVIPAPRLVRVANASTVAQASRIATYDYGNWGAYNSQPTAYPTASLHELSWVQMGVNGSAAQTNYYYKNGVRTYSYGDEGLIYSAEAGPQRSWAAAMGPPPPPANPNYYSACSNGGTVYTGKPAAYISNPYYAFRHWTSAWQSQFSGYEFNLWYIDGLQEAGFRDSNRFRTSVCLGGNTYTLNSSNFNLINWFIIPGIEQIPNSKTTVLCDCWGGDSGNPYISSNYPFGLSSNNAGDLPPTVLYYPAVAGGRSEGSYENGGTHNSLGVWQGVENIEIVTGNSGLYDFLQPWINEDSASPQGLIDRMFIIASIDLTVNCALIANGACSGYTVYQLLISGEASGKSMCFYPDDTNCTHVYPEVYVTFASPFVAMPANSTSSRSGCSNCNGIQTFLSANGTYFREYGSGFDNGVRIGRCAVVVNPDAVVHNWPTSGELTDDYTVGSSIVSLQLRGANIDSGGTAKFVTGIAPRSVSPGTGIIVCDKSK
jgi:hypothetical protein